MKTFTKVRPMGKITFNVEEVTDGPEKGEYFIKGEIIKSTIDNQPVGKQGVAIVSKKELDFL